MSRDGTYKELLERVGGNTHDDAMREVARLKERSAILAMIMERLEVDDHWGVPDKFNQFFFEYQRLKDK